MYPHLIVVRVIVVKKIKSCRVCGSHALSPVFLPSEDSVSPLRVPIPRTLKNSINKDHDTKNPVCTEKFVLCDPTLDSKACGLLQRETSSKPENLSYIPSATFRMNRDHLRAAATEALELISGRDCAALDIGCNDGTLLSYYPRWVDRFGVDTDPCVSQIGEWAWSAQAAFPSSELDQAFGSKKFDIITCISTFEYCEDPSKLLEAIKNRLVDDGILILETLYAPMIMTGNAIETLTPDISGLYSLAVLEQIIREKGMKIFRGALTSKEGGSIRLFITHDNVSEYDFDPWSERLARLWDEETVLALRERAPYQAFASRCHDARDEFQAMLSEIEKRAETVHILGTDKHAKILMDWSGAAGNVITHAVEIDTKRRIEHGASLPFSNIPQDHNIPIISEAQSRTLEPDYFLAPIHLKREMLEYWREAIQAGGKMIFATPNPHIVDSQNYTAEYGKIISQGDSAAGVETLRAILHATGGPRLISNNDNVTAKSA